MSLVLGCDPEVFLKNQAGKFISSVGRIGGSKDMPRPIGEGCAVQEDNVAVEFNTPPCKSAAEYIKHIRYNLDWMRNQVAAMGLELAIVPSAVFDDEELNSEGAMTFGCEPDFNAYEGGAVNPKPKAANKNLRSAGGHIHIQLEHDEVDVLELIKAMDAFVTIPLMRHDKDTARRELYGKPGAFRPKPYGVEYRTPSNHWISSDELISFVWEQTDRALAYVKAGGTFDDAMCERIQRSINTSDMALGEAILKDLGI